MNTKMSDSLKEKWLHLYGVANVIGSFDPWNRFSEDNCFSFIPKEKNKTYIFSFIGESADRCGIALYVNEEDYIKGRKRLEARNEKEEPAIFLQNAYMCFWGNREDISKKSYEQIKELGLSFRGKGAWIHFERFEVGYFPFLLEENEVDMMINAFENLFMMLKAIYEDGLNPEFEKGNTLVRWYDENEKLYYTHPFKVSFPKNLSITEIIVEENNPSIQKAKNTETSEYSIELDWAYVSACVKNDLGEEVFPLVLTALSEKNGFILPPQIIYPQDNKESILLNSILEIVFKIKKPKEIIVCDEEIQNIISDFCKKIGIKLTIKKSLKKSLKARKELFQAE